MYYVHSLRLLCNPQFLPDGPAAASPRRAGPAAPLPGAAGAVRAQPAPRAPGAQPARRHHLHARRRAARYGEAEVSSLTLTLLFTYIVLFFS